MKRELTAFFLGMLSPFVFILGASLFEKPGTDSVLELLSGSFALFAFLGLGQFHIMPKGPRQGIDRLSTVLAMVFPLLVVTCIIGLFESRQTFIHQGVPLFVSGLGGIFAGSYAASVLKS